MPSPQVDMGSDDSDNDSGSSGSEVEMDKKISGNGGDSSSKIEGHSKELSDSDSESDNSDFGKKVTKKSEKKIETKESDASGDTDRFMESEIMFTFSGTINALGVSSSCCVKASENISVPVNSVKDGVTGVSMHNGKHIIKDIQITHYDNRFPISLVTEVVGIEAPVSTTRKYTHYGRSGHEILLPEAARDVNKTIMQFNSARGVNFAKKYPGFNADNLRTGITPLGEGKSLVAQNHPVVALYDKYMDANKDEVEPGEKLSKKIGKKEIHGFRVMENMSIEYLLKSLENEVKKNMPLASLSDISIKFSPNTESTTEGKNTWEHAIELPASGESATNALRKKKLIDTYNCFVTLKITHSPVL